MNLLLRLFLTLSAVSFFVIICLIQNKINPLSCRLGEYHWVVYLGYMLIPFILTGISLLFSLGLSKDEMKKVDSVETSNNDFLANYLAFFFVALSISDWIVFWAVFGMTLLFTFVSRVSFFNPVLLVFGFNFYYVHTGEKTKVMLITRNKLKNPETFGSKTVRRINDYTFIEI